MPPLSHLTSCTPTKFNFYLANSLAAAVSEPALYRLLTFHVPNKMSLFLCLVCDASSRNTPPLEIRVGEYFTSGLFCLQRKHLAYEYFLTCFFFSRGGVVSAPPNPQAGGPPLVGCPRLLIQFICSYPPYRRSFLHPQLENAPCYGDRGPQTWQEQVIGILYFHKKGVCVCVSTCAFLVVFIITACRSEVGKEDRKGCTP